MPARKHGKVERKRGGKKKRNLEGMAPWIDGWMDGLTIDIGWPLVNPIGHQGSSCFGRICRALYYYDPVPSINPFNQGG